MCQCRTFTNYVLILLILSKIRMLAPSPTLYVECDSEQTVKGWLTNSNNSRSRSRFKLEQLKFFSSLFFNMSSRFIIGLATSDKIQHCLRFSAIVSVAIIETLRRLYLLQQKLTLISHKQKYVSWCLKNLRTRKIVQCLKPISHYSAVFFASDLNRCDGNVHIYKSNCAFFFFRTLISE